MKLSILTQEAISGAAKAIDRDGIPKDSVWSQYYVVVDGKEYPFKHLVYEAFKVLGVTDVKFESNDGYRNYMVGTMGYQMEYYLGGYNFFTRDELDYYASIARKPYRKDNPAHQVYPQRLNALIAKVNYWGRQVTSVAYTFRADRHWLTGNTANIKPYFWPRMYKGRDEDIFFNVEVNGDKRTLSYKMDEYRNNVEAVSLEEVRLEANKLLEESGTRLYLFEFKDGMPDRLIREDIKFFFPSNMLTEVLRVIKDTETGHLREKELKEIKFFAYLMSQ
ncbi:hypothetical protein [Pedobacter sp. AJM]|uniref:hypothetical protein n=1 Tax=Pedobacter sp. AJM TaxID=2003629 RepID=UPI000B4A71CD|nr:hypothetical protein [Pedobacter sp. AJM]OWK70318.1 hypothetical protein CBW18_12720 [Pedobacter sp. AJM]